VNSITIQGANTLILNNAKTRVGLVLLHLSFLEYILLVDFLKILQHVMQKKS